MIELPHSLLDFADALRMLADSQADVTELVTKWDELCDTVTPKTVTITVGGITHEVSNLAKIREDLVEGLSLDKPTVSLVKFRSRQASGMQSAGLRYGSVYHTDGTYPYNDRALYTGAYSNLVNEMRVVCMPDKVSTQSSPIVASLQELPRVMFVGAVRNAGETPVSDMWLLVDAPAASLLQNNVLVNDYYCAQVTFVNRNLGDGTGTIVPAPVTVHLCTRDGNVITRAIPELKSVSYVFFAAPGRNTVLMQEIIPDIP